jgi:hypothetical protein
MMRSRAVAEVVAMAAIFAIALFFAIALIFGVGNRGTPSFADLGLGALVGALIGAVSTHLLRELAERRREARERNAWLRVVKQEQTKNQQRWVVVQGMIRDTSATRPDDTLPLHTGTWEASKVRLAELLLDSGDFESVANYYTNLEDLMMGFEAAQRIRERSSDNRTAKKFASVMSYLLEEDLQVPEHFHNELSSTLTKYLG